MSDNEPRPFFVEMEVDIELSCRGNIIVGIQAANEENAKRLATKELERVLAEGALHSPVAYVDLPGLVEEEDIRVIKPLQVLTRLPVDRKGKVVSWLELNEG
jgi:hypothetical protein